MTRYYVKDELLNRIIGLREKGYTYKMIRDETKAPISTIQCALHRAAVTGYWRPKNTKVIPGGARHVVTDKR